MRPRKSLVDWPCRVTLAWDIPPDQPPGNYRIVHHGRYQREADEEPQLFESATEAFLVQ